MHDVTNDHLDALLGPPPPASDWPRRRALLARTQRALRWRRRGRRLVVAAAVAACLVLGLLTVCWAPPPTPRHSEPRAELHREQPRAQPPSPAVALEWQAVDAPVQQAELYRRAGDVYLGTEADPQSAVRCYQAALEEGNPEALTISSDDSWLLMAIKEARHKEKNDAK